jgi:hygromycin-B 7''-O-kinase
MDLSGEALPPDSFGAWGAAASTSLEGFRVLRADPPRWLPAAIDIARRHRCPCVSPQVFSTGTNLVVGLDDHLILKIFPPLLRRQFVSERGALMQLAGRIRVPIPKVVTEGGA